MTNKLLKLILSKNYWRYFVLYFYHCLIFSEFTYSQRPLLIGETEQIIDSLIAYNKQRIYDNDVTELIRNNDKILSLLTDLPEMRQNYYRGMVYNSQGIIYNKLRENEKSIDFFNKSIEFALISRDSILAARAYNNKAIAQIYHDYTISEAIDSYKSAQLYLGPNDSILNNRINLNIAWAYTKKKQYNHAKEYIDLSKDFTLNYGNPQEKTYFYHIDGQFHESKDSLNYAIKQYEKALEIGNQFEVDAVPEIYRDYANALEGIDSLEKALQNLKKYADLKEKNFKLTQLAQNEIANSRFEVARLTREKRKAEGKMNRSQNLSAIALGSLFVLFIFLFTLWRLNKKNIKLADLLSVQNEKLQITNDKYEKTLQQKSQFISTVSHELRTPLYGVVGITSLLLDSKNLDYQQNEYLHSLKFSGDYLLNLINDILLMSKIEVNKIEPIIENFDIKELAYNIVQSFSHRTDETENNFKLDIDDTIPSHISGDRLRLSQILINLIGNANKFAQNGNILLRLSKTTTNKDRISILFEVIDNGIGIPADKQEEIFESFSQVDASESAFKGTGLGLPIIKKLIEFYGGTIHVESELGKGSKFWFQLDFKITEEENLSLNRSNVSSINVINRKILIVEDNKINQLVTRKTLENSNFICDIAENGQIAVEMLAHKEFDAILMDLHMPVMNGIEATQEIRKFNTSIPIILLTASEMKMDDPLLAGVEINEILIKPYDTQHFFDVILKALQKNSIT